MYTTKASHRKLWSTFTITLIWSISREICRVTKPLPALLYVRETPEEAVCSSGKQRTKYLVSVQILTSLSLSPNFSTAASGPKDINFSLF